MKTQTKRNVLGLFLLGIFLWTSCVNADKGVGEFEIKDDEKEWNKKVTGVTLDKESLTMEVGEVASLAATVSPNDAFNKIAIWESSNTGVALVDQKGNITALKPGTVVISITTTDGNKTAECKLTVTTPSQITMTTTKAIGDKIKLWIDAEAAKDFVWIDLNNDGKKDPGEAVTNFNNFVEYELKAQTITLYGKVTTLYCFLNQLTQLDVTQNTALKRLNCIGNQLQNLDVTHNTKLTNLDCASNQLQNLDVTHNTKLTDLNCTSNQLQNLDVSQNTKLTLLDCTLNQLTQLDVTQNTELEELHFVFNQLQNLDISQNTKLTLLECQINQLQSLDVSKNTKLGYMVCGNNPFTQVNLANGNNANMDVYINGCPSLTCIKVDKGFTPPSSWEKDATASYRNDGSDCP